MPSKPRWPDWPETLPRDWRRQAIALMAGVDEAGRGPLAGPVVAAAVLLDERRPIAGLDDSKALTAAQRERLDAAIRERALCFAVAEASVEEIDALNILHASLLAMRRAVEALGMTPLRVLVDGNQLPPLALPMHAIVGGDARVKAISAASILAKVHRDRLCLALHERHPQYGFDRHKGYPSPAHLAALRLHGACVVHRRSYAPVRAVLAAAADLVAAGGGAPCEGAAAAPDGPLPAGSADDGGEGDSDSNGAAAAAAAAGSSDLAPRAAPAATTADARVAALPA